MLHAISKSDLRDLHREQERERHCLYLLSENFTRTWRELGVLLGSSLPDSPEVLHFTCTAVVKCYYSIQTRISLPWKDVHHPLVSQRFRMSQPESKTSLRLLPTVHHAKRLSKVPFEPSPLFPGGSVSK